MIAATGVKYLHSKAEENDIGVYFEANGHGTMLFRKAKLESICGSFVKDPEKQKHFQTLLAYLGLANPVVGDAMANLLLVEAALALLGMDVLQWAGLYTDLPSRTIKAPVKDKTLFKPTEDEQRIVAPIEVQQFIDEACKKYESGRSFVRPSGTEDVLRVHAEAKTQEMADFLATDVKEYLKKFA